ncbi:MAG: zinc ABC transporter substrate-binding protein, partial [Pseudomonadota bacterium]|nr:zinc ABC transporter substrate-binding protein [Pseudomonadota bacterium]
EPSAQAIAALVRQIKREKIRAVFIENMTSPRMAQMLARETGAILGGTVYSDALSPPGGPAPTYLDMLRHNTTLFAQAMRPA